MSVMLRRQENQLLCWRKESSTGIESLSTQINALSVGQEASAAEKHSIIPSKLQGTSDVIEESSNRVEALQDSIEFQTREISTLKENTRDNHQTLTASLQETSKLTRQGLDTVSTKSDQILDAIVETRQDITRSIQNLQQTSLVPYGGKRRQVIRFDERDEVLILMFQLYELSNVIARIIIAEVLTPFKSHCPLQIDGRAAHQGWPPCAIPLCRHADHDNNHTPRADVDGSGQLEL